MIRVARLSLFVLLAWSVTGCNDAVKPPATATVSGTVNMDKKPMTGGEIRFSVAGQPAKVLPIKDGAFSGEVTVGKNLVEVVWDVDGPPHPMDPTARMKVNSVAAQFSGPQSTLSADIDAKGKSDLKFEVTSARGR